MSLPRFHNRPNQRLEIDGREIWHARAVAVVASVVATVHGQRHVALIERGPALPDEVGKLALPSGYLDWDETLFDAARREAYEEIGLDLAEWSASREPWRIHDAPQQRQNVSVHFYFARELTALPLLTNSHADTGEISQTLWLPIEDAIAGDLAFGHALVLSALLERLTELAR